MRREGDLGRFALGTELGQLKAQGGGVWRRDPDTGDMEQVPDEEVARWMERPRVPDPESLLDRSGRDIEGRADLGQFALGTELEQLKAQGGGVWRRDPDTGDMEQVPDEEVARWMERPRVPDPESLLDRSGRDIEGRADLGQFALETELEQLKAQGGGVWRRDPDTGDMEQVPDEEVARWMERPRVPDPENLLDRGRGPESGGIQEGADLGQFALGTELEQLKAQGGGVWSRDPDTGDMVRVPDEEVERWRERPHVPDPENLMGRGRGPESGGIEQAEDLLGEVGGDVSEASGPPELRGSVEGSISSGDAGRRYLEENNLDGHTLTSYWEQGGCHYL